MQLEFKLFNGHLTAPTGHTRIDAAGWRCRRWNRAIYLARLVAHNTQRHKRREDFPRAAREREKEPLMSHVFSGNGRGGHEMIITAFQTTTTTGEYRYEHKGGEQTQKSITFSPIGQNKSSSQQSNGVPLNIHQPADQTHF